MSKKNILALMILFCGALSAQTTDCSTPIVVTASQPFFEDFECGTIPTCWSSDVYEDGWGFGWGGDASGVRGAYSGMYNAACTPSWYGFDRDATLITPWLDVSDIDSCVLVFMQLRRAGGSGLGDSIEVRFRASASDAWQVLATYTSAMEDWTESVVALPAMVDSCQIGFFHSLRSPHGCGLDDVFVGARSGCTRVGRLRAVGVGPDSVSFAWSAGGVDGTEYLVGYWCEMHDTMYVSTTDTAITIGGLGGGTMYHFGVATECGNYNNYFPTAHARQRTAPGEPVHVPYKEMHEGLGGTLPPGWTLVSGDVVTGETMYVRGNGTDEGGSDTVVVVLPPTDLPLWRLQLRMSMMPMGTARSSSFSVGYATEPLSDSSYVRVAMFYSDEWPSFGYRDVAVTFGGAPDSARIVLRREPVASGAGSGWMLKPVVIDSVIECQPPYNIIATDVTDESIGVVVRGVADGYRLYFSDGTTVDSVDITDSVYLFTGLDATTNYTVSAATICLDGSVTAAISVVVRTACGPKAIPFVEDFETCTRGRVPECWTSLGGNASVGGSLSGDNVMGFSAGAAALPRMDMHTGLLQVGFWLRPYNYYIDTASTFSVGYMTDLDDSSTFVPLESWVSGEWSEDGRAWVEVEMTGAPSDAYIVLWGQYTPRPPVDIAAFWEVDSVVVESISPCHGVTHFYVASLGHDYVTVAFDGGHSGDYYLHITDGAAYTDSVYVVGVNTYTFTGLDEASRYTVGIAAACPGGRSATATIGVVTHVQPVQLPYSTGFERTDDAKWRLLYGDEGNMWFRGTAVASSGTRSLYITDDGGVSNHYTANNFAIAHAYKTFWIESGVDVAVGFDWRVAAGGAGYAYIAPASYEPDVHEIPHALADNMPGWVDLAGGTLLPTGTGWQTRRQLFTVGTPGYYHLVFSWYSGRQTNVQPPLAVDNVTIEYGTAPTICLPVTSLQVDDVTDSMATVNWIPYGVEDEWEVTVGDSVCIVGSPHHVVTGLQQFTTYTVRVRPICGEGDTGEAVGTWFTTGVCDGALTMQNYQSSQTTFLSENSPMGSPYSEYCYTQTLIPATHLDAVGRLVNGMAVMPYGGDISLPGNDIYLANVEEDNLAGGFIHPGGSHRFVKVLSDVDLSHNGEEEMLLAFDSVFEWDGQSNVLISVMRHGRPSWGSGSLPLYKAHMENYKRTREFSSSYPIDMQTVSGSSGSIVVGNVKLISCVGDCMMPRVNDVSSTGDMIVIRFEPADSMEVFATTGEWDDNVYGTIIPAGMTQYTFYGLTPMTRYNVGIRHLCRGGVSDWAVFTVSTLDHDCLPPIDFALAGGDYTRQSFTWNPAEAETSWEIRVFNSFYNSTHIVRHTAEAVIGDLYPGTPYKATIRSLCGVAGYPGEWGDTVSFSTAECRHVDGVTVGDVTGNTATVQWQPVEGSIGYRIYYGLEGFYDYEATMVNVDVGATSYTMTGLDAATDYEVYVLNRCAEGVYSAVDAGQRIAFSTTIGIDAADGAALALYPNPASGSVTLAFSGFDGQAVVQIVDMNGRSMVQRTTMCGQVTLDVSALAAGVYFVRVQSAGGAVVRKLVVY